MRHVQPQIQTKKLPAQEAQDQIRKPCKTGRIEAFCHNFGELHPKTRPQAAKPESEKDTFQNCARVAHNCARVAHNCARVANPNFSKTTPSIPKCIHFQGLGPEFPELSRILSSADAAAQISCFVARRPA